MATRKQLANQESSLNSDRCLLNGALGDVRGSIHIGKKFMGLKDQGW